MPLLTITGLHKQFNLEAGFFARFGRFVTAVNGISLAIEQNETYGLVGESGCGKTTTARLIVRMYEPDSGSIVFQRQGDSVDVGGLRGDDLRGYRQRVKYVFQDPARSLNPRMSVYEVLVCGLRHSDYGKRLGAKKLREKAAAALEEVGLSAADLDRRPSEFSGGQRQRISIARSLLPQPELLICDEVVSALDVSIQCQILNLLLDIRERRVGEGQAMSLLFIAHDLKVACYFCDRIGVMYSGELMEEAPAADLWKDGRHPYTQMLFSSATGLKSATKPIAHNGKNTVDTKAHIASHPAPCCAFAPRCPQAAERCFREQPPLVQVADGHTMRCHL
ncbi:MAG: ABC transporter ATP-binding protein [Treponema sp.]|jgi:oligopeptide/dipeptide ABC transporter ATP-binding protein|nr:ABC transporter ATP-binding protein [Treponema sp.]